MASELKAGGDVSALEILQTFATNLAMQREAIAQRNWAGLAEIIPKLQHAMSLVQAFPGGSAGLRAELSVMAAQNDNRVSKLLEDASSDRLVAAELIRVNVNRLNALRSLFENGALDHTESGQFTTGSPGSLLSRRV